MLPKCNAGADVANCRPCCACTRPTTTSRTGQTKIIALITETAAGVLSAGTYADPNPRLAGVTWGAEDLSASIGASATRDEDGRYTDVFRLARAVTILGARVADVVAIDTVFVNFRDADGLRRECIEAERDGFTAKMAIHPAQVPVINEAFTPSAGAVARSQAIVRAFADAGNPGVVGIDGQMYDRPHLRRAERLLARARRGRGNWPESARAVKSPASSAAAASKRLA